MSLHKLLVFKIAPIESTATRTKRARSEENVTAVDVRKYSFAYRVIVINIWNSLSSDNVNACSISVFEQKFESVDFTPFVRVEFT